MQFDYRYLGQSGVESAMRDTQMSFVPDASRQQPTFFRGELAKHIPFREAISALHHVVVSDMRFQPKDKSEYKEWRAQQDEQDRAELIAQRSANKQRINELRSEMGKLQAKLSRKSGGFYKAQRRYFNWLYKVNYDAWYVLDPVITVHPDEIFFECFSQDESSYGRLACSYEMFKDIGEFSCGTTNIDYSQALYTEFQKIRDYKSTHLEVDPGGFTVQTTGEADFREVKIDLPDTWVRGFLQVSSAMTIEGASFTLHPLDLYNLCMVLRRFKEKVGPRSMRYHLTPGAPVRVTFDPWDKEIVCRRSIYTGPEQTMIRVWGRRRIHQLERLIPIARSFTVHLLGRGLPSFYVADLGDMSFTLGLSGWTSNDWSRAGNFDLLAPRARVDSETKRRVFDALRSEWLQTPDQIAGSLGLDRKVVLGALGAWTQAGRVMYDLDKQVFRARELARDPIPVDLIRFSNPREAEATSLVDAGAVRTYAARDDGQGGVIVTGSVQKGSRTFDAELRIDADDRLVGGSSNSGFYIHNRLLKGPCEIMLALRMHHSRQQHA